MKIICNRSCQIAGYGVVRPDQTIDLPKERIDARIAACFRAEDGSKLTPTEKTEDADAKPDAKADEEAMVAKLAKLDKAKLIAQLESIKGASFDDTMTKTELARALLRARGAIK